VKDCEFDYFGLCDVDRETLMTIAALNTGTTDLLAALDAGVLTLTLNRPEARNAMSRAMNHALARQLAVAALEPNVRCIVLTGAARAFAPEVTSRLWRRAPMVRSARQPSTRLSTGNG
jgi:enoyl-CoA hydratase/carnithine racemase